MCVLFYMHAFVLNTYTNIVVSYVRRHFLYYITYIEFVIFMYWRVFEVHALHKNVVVIWLTLRIKVWLNIFMKSIKIPILLSNNEIKEQDTAHSNILFGTSKFIER